MPSQKTVNVSQDRYTLAPLLIFQILSYSKLQAIESMLFNHIVLHSINFHANSTGRSWIKISPSEFSKQRGYTRQRISEALGELVRIGYVEFQETYYPTSSGVQKGREFRLVSNLKLQSIYDVLTTSALPVGDKPEETPTNAIIVLGDKSEVTPCKVSSDTLTGLKLHLVRPWVTPWGVKLPKSLEIFNAKYSSINIKEFIKTFSEFSNSYLELYSIELNSRRSFFKIELKIAALIRQYGLYKVFVAMTVNLLDKTAPLGNLEVLSEFLETHYQELQIAEENLRKHSDSIYLEIFQVHQDLANSDIELESFRKTFRHRASALLSRMRLEQSSSQIFMYSSFQDDAIDIFDRCNYNMDSFTKEIVIKTNLFFKSKILGMRGLNYVQSLDH